MKVLTMNNAEAIMEPYFQQIEAGNPPSFESLLDSYDKLLAFDPGSIEFVCFTSLLITMYPAEYEIALDAKFKKMGFKFRVADMKV